MIPTTLCSDHFSFLWKALSKSSVKIVGNEYFHNTPDLIFKIFSKIGFFTIAFYASFGQHLLTKIQQMLNFQKVQKKLYWIVKFQGDVKNRIFNGLWLFCSLTCAPCNLFQNSCFKIVSKFCFKICFKISC